MYKMRKSSAIDRQPPILESFNKPSALEYSPVLIGIMLLTVVYVPKLHEVVRIFVYFEIGKIAIFLSFICILTAKVKNPVFWFRLPQVKIFLLFIVWMFITAVMGRWPSHSVQSAMMYLKTMLYFILVIKSIYSINDLYKLMWVLVMSIVVFDLLIIMQSSLGRSDSGGYTLDANDSALVICITMPLFINFYKQCVGWRRLLMLIGVVLGVVGVLSTASRGGVLSLCSVFAYLFITSKGAFFKKTLLLGIAFGLIIILMPQNLQQRFERLEEGADYNMSAKHGRMMVWERAISIIDEYPVLGIGMNNFVFTESEVNNQSRGVVAHNFILQVTTEMGIPGGFLLLTILGVSWWQMRKIRCLLPKNDKSKLAVLVTSFECGWVAFFVGGQFLSLAFGSQIVFLAACTTTIWRLFLRGDFDQVICPQVSRV